MRNGLSAWPGMCLTGRGLPRCSPTSRRISVGWTAWSTTLAWPIRTVLNSLNREQVLLQVNTNYLGVVFCCQAAIPLLRGSDNPRIVNISSASALHFDEMSHLSIYASTKAAVERFSRDLALELQPDGIGVTCIRPGGAITQIAAN